MICQRCNEFVLFFSLIFFVSILELHSRGHVKLGLSVHPSRIYTSEALRIIELIASIVHLIDNVGNLDSIVLGSWKLTIELADMLISLLFIELLSGIGNLLRILPTTAERRNFSLGYSGACHYFIQIQLLVLFNIILKLVDKRVFSFFNSLLGMLSLCFIFTHVIIVGTFRVVPQLILGMLFLDGHI